MRLRAVLSLAFTALSAFAFGPGGASAYGLEASSQGVGTGPPAKILLGAHVQPLSSRSTKAQVLAFESALGRKLDIDNVYPGFVWSTGFKARAQWDIAGGRIPMFSWGARFGASGCVTLADIASGKYDTLLNAQAATIRSLRSTLWLRLFFEPDIDAQRCSNPSQNPKVYVAAFRHIVALFRAAGAANAKWVWAPGYSLYANSKWPQWYPGSDVVDVVAEDTYNATTAQEPFSAVACKIGPRAGKPFAITETGARSNEQLAWLGNVKAACPGLTAFIYFDAKGTSGFDYEMTTPKAMAAFKAIAQ